VALINQSAPILDSQVDTSDDIQAWSVNVADIAEQFRAWDAELAGVLTKVGPSFEEAGLWSRICVRHCPSCWPTW
jgi:phospholipid/cholesterol/gamma-HCH transport system substrate-binding protein